MKWEQRNPAGAAYVSRVSEDANRWTGLPSRTAHGAAVSAISLSFLKNMMKLVPGGAQGAPSPIRLPGKSFHSFPVLCLRAHGIEGHQSLPARHSTQTSRLQTTLISSLPFGLGVYEACVQVIDQ